MVEMDVAEVRRISVFGSGVMGRQIALLCALAGYQVTNHDAVPAALLATETWLDEYLAARVARGKLDADAAQAVRARVRLTADTALAAREADFVIEAVTEDLELKRELFALLDRHCPPRTVLASNSSTIVSSRLAEATTRPDRVLNMHFFNPALVMELVEVVRGPHTAAASVTLTMDLAKKLGKHPILLQKEISGFVVNRILGAITSEALYLLENGIATVAEIDEAAVKGLRHPIGPFSLMDLAGIDVAYRVRLQRFRDSGDAKDLPHPLLEEKYRAGHWGKKSGRGWYDYTTGAAGGGQAQ